MFRLLSLVIGYFIGCISSAFIVSKVMKTDLRKQGSGNLGSTNALRVLGLKAGLATFAGDVLKSVLAFVICTFIFPDETVLAGVYACVGVMLGHDFPFYLNFKGGKGIAVNIGMVICLSVLVSPWVAVIAFSVGIIGIAVSHYISVGSIAFSVVIPICIYFSDMPTEVLIVTILTGCLAIWLHRGNIGRLRAGTENRFSFKKAQS